MRKTTKLTLGLYLKHLRPLRGRVVLSFFSIVVAVSASMAFPVLEKWFVNTLVDAKEIAAAVPTLFIILAIIIAADSLGWIAWRVANYALAHIEAKGMETVANECFAYLQGHSTHFFNNNFSGALVKKIHRIVGAFEGVLDEFFYNLTPAFLRVVLATGILFYVDVRLGIIFLVWEILFLGLNLFLALYKVKRYDLPKAEADTRMTAALADAITNNVNVKLFAALPYESKRFGNVSQEWFRRTRLSWFFNSHIEAVQALLMIFLNFAMVYTGIRLWQNGQVTVGDFVLIQGVLIEIMRQLWDFGRTVRRVYEHFANAAEMTVVLNTPQAVRDRARAKTLAVRRGAIEFDHVDFSYQRYEAEAARLRRARAEEEEGPAKAGLVDEKEVESLGVIQDLSFSIKPGEKIGLIGPSGGGKSTLTKLLLRLFDVDKGRILIDGQDIAKVTQDSLRSQIAMVPQDPILFHRSLRDNIRYGRIDATDKEVMAASKLARCHDFIMKFPKQYDTFVGERGVKLSGGERQRVAIARAILSNTKILILDEATSSLDSESERLIQEALAHLMKNKTAIVIAHRLSTIVNMDRVLVLEGGRLVEEGSHADLVQQSGSVYKKLWELQVGGYLGK